VIQEASFGSSDDLDIVASDWLQFELENNCPYFDWEQICFGKNCLFNCVIIIEIEEKRKENRTYSVFMHSGFDRKQVIWRVAERLEAQHFQCEHYYEYINN
jgi:hypothetical protein